MELTEELKRSIFEKVRRRMVQDAMMEKGNTQLFHRMLALWLELERAIYSRANHEAKPNGCAPWNCPDKRVRDAWDAVTNPENVLALESLYYQLPEGPQMEMGRKALQFCRKRRDKK